MAWGQLGTATLHTQSAQHGNPSHQLRHPGLQGQGTAQLRGWPAKGTRSSHTW